MKNESPRPIVPLILGTGNAGMAMARACQLARITEPLSPLGEPRFVPRGFPLEQAVAAAAGSTPLLMIARPHGLHAAAILDAARVGITHVLCEKPACVSLEELKQLEGSSALPNVSVFHVYRQTWGPQELRRIAASGELGEIFAIEGRYWQSSAAQKALAPPAGGPAVWKSDTALSGPGDVYLDLVPHWMDLANFIVGATPSRTRMHKSFANAEAPHRDTHVQLELEYPNRVRGLASVSKTVHGAGNRLELEVLGTRGTASWSFERPDEIAIGRGADLTLTRRTSSELGTRLKPFHAGGWIEGYVEIIRQTARKIQGVDHRPVPTLAEHLETLRCIFTAET